MTDPIPPTPGANRPPDAPGAARTDNARTARPETGTEPRTAARTEAMLRARRAASTTKRARVAATVASMLAEGTPITFAAVARHARVSTWLVYSPVVRDLIHTARAQQHDTRPAADTGVGTPAGDLRTDLALARAEITRLRAERNQQHRQLQLALGARLDNISKADLITRVDELTAANTELAATAEQHGRDNQDLRRRVRDLDDDLAATRTSLRRMIRAENRGPEQHAGASSPAPTSPRGG